MKVRHFTRFLSYLCYGNPYYVQRHVTMYVSGFEKRVTLRKCYICHSLYFYQNMQQVKWTLSLKVQYMCPDQRLVVVTCSISYSTTLIS